jgi:RNA polymerase sigma-70 factor (ECF subfamily)
VVPVESSASHDPLGDLLGRCARGDIAAFEQVYDIVAGAVLGLAIRVVRDPSQAEEVAQEVLIDVWRNAARFDTARGSARAWIMTIAHRRAVDRVRHYQASSNRENRVSAQDERCDRDVVFEQVESSLEREQVRRCLDALTELQRESITLAYYDGYTYPEVATLLQTPLGTVKTRMRDGMIRLRDCMGLG